MEYCIVVAAAACAQWAVALLKLGKQRNGNKYNTEHGAIQRCVILIISFVRNYKRETQDVDSVREREREKGSKRGKATKRTTIFPSLTFRLQFACANSKTQIAIQNWNVFSPLLFAPICYIWLDFILFYSLFILLHLIACGFSEQTTLAACCSWFSFHFHCNFEAWQKLTTC